MKHFTLFAFALLFSAASALAQPAFSGKSRQSAKATLPQRIITKQPQGTLYDHLLASCVGYENYYLTYYSISSIVTCRIASIVEADNGTVYIQNLLPTFPVNTWVKAERGQGDTLIVKQQEVYDYRNEKYSVCRMKYTGDETHTFPTYEKDAENPDFTLIWKDGVLRTTSDLDDMYDRTIGIINSKGVWYKYVASKIVLEPQTAAPTLLPEGAQVEQFIVRYTMKQRIIVEESLADTQEYDTLQVAFNGSDVYVKPYGRPNLPGWIKGTIAGDQVVFDSPQYLGADDEIISHYYFVGGKERHFSDDIYAEYYNGYFRDFDTESQVVAQFDPETRSMTFDQTFMLYNGSTSVSDQYGEQFDYAVSEAHSYIKDFYSPKFFKYVEKPDTPRRPDFISYDDYMERDGYENIRLCFYIYPETKAGDYLDINNLYYVIYVDDDDAPFDFDSSDYRLIDGDFTYVPFTLSDNYDILNYGVRHIHYVYFSGFDRIGVQSIFAAEDGQEYPSEICWYDVETGESYSAVKNIEVAANGREEAFDLAGRRVSTSAKGLIIKRQRTADGQLHVVKTINR